MDVLNKNQMLVAFGFLLGYTLSELIKISKRMYEADCPVDICDSMENVLEKLKDFAVRNNLEVPEN